MDHELTNLLLASGALRWGAFRLHSGHTSPFFVDFAQISSGRGLLQLGTLFAKALASFFPQTTVICGPAYKGIVLATATATAAHAVGRDLRICTLRKEPKDHGEGGRFLGSRPDPADHLVLVDDVLSDGATKLQIIAELQRECGVRPLGILVGLDRRPRSRRAEQIAGLPLCSLLNMAALIEALPESHREQAEVLRRWYDNEQR